MRLAVLSDIHGNLPVLFGAARRLAEAAGCADLPYYPDDVWDSAEREFRAEQEF